MHHYRFSFLLLFALSCFYPLQAEDEYKDVDLSSPRATIIAHLGSLQPGNYHYKTAARAFLQKGRSEEEAIELAVGLKNFLDEKGIHIDLNNVPKDSDYINPRSKFHQYQLVESLPKIYLTKVQDQWLYSEETAQYIKDFYEDNYFLGKQALLKWLPPFFKEKTVFKLYVWQVAAMLIVLLLLGSIYQLVVSLVKQILRPLSAKWGFEEMNTLAGPLTITLLILLFRLTILYLNLPFPVHYSLIKYSKSLLAFMAMLLCYHLVDASAFYINKRTLEKSLNFNLVLLPMAKVSLKVIIIIVGLLVILQGLQYNIKGLLAGVGIGGLGFALASQDTIKNFFGSLVILTDRPFDVADHIVSGNIEGKVEEIGFRSTRIRTSQGSIIYVPNGKLADSHITNHGLRQYKEFSTSLAISHHTPKILLDTFIEGLQKIAAYHPSTREGKYYVYLYDLKESVLSIKFEVKFNVTDYATELQSRHELILSIIKLAESLGICFSFPTYTLHMESFPEKKLITPEYITDPVVLKERLQDFLGNHQAPPTVGVV